jgi:hypothetical protein
MEILPSPRDHPLPFRPFLIRTCLSQCEVSAPTQSEISVSPLDALTLNLPVTSYSVCMRELIELAPSLVAAIILSAISWTLIFYGNYVTQQFKSEHPRWFKSIVALLLAAAIFGLCVVLQYLWAAPVASLPKDQLAAENALRGDVLKIVEI